MASRVIKLQNSSYTLLPVTDSKYVQYYNGTSYESTKTALDNRVKKVTSTDNAVVRFDGTGGNIQNSGVTITDTNQIIPETLGFKPKQRTFNVSGWYRIFRGSISPIHLMLTRNYNSPSPEGYDIDIETFDITVTDDLWGIATITQNAGYFGTGSETNQEIQKIRVYGYNGAPSSNPNNTDKSKICIDVYIIDRSPNYGNTYYISGYSLGTANDFINYAELTADNLEYVEFCQAKNSTRYYSEFTLVDGFKTNKKAVAQSFIKDGGTSSQFLKADGSVDSNVYATSSSVDTLLNSYLSNYVPKQFNTRFYPFVKADNTRSIWHKVTFPWQGVTSSSVMWIMTSMEIVLSGNYQNGNNGKIYLQYYFMKSASNVWTASDVRGIAIGYRILENEVTIKYDIANPGIMYIKTNNNTYNTFAIENLSANDTAPNYDFRNTTITSISEDDIPSTATNTVTLYHAVTTQNYSSTTDTRYVKKAGDTMTGTLSFNVGADGYADSFTSKGINMGNANITGVNSIFTADASDDSREGFHFYRDSSHVDSIHAKNGVLYFTPNRPLNNNGTSYPVITTNSYSSEQISIPSSVTLSNHIQYVQGQEIDFDENFANTLLGTSTTVTPSATLNNTNTSHKYWYNT